MKRMDGSGRLRAHENEFKRQINENKHKHNNNKNKINNKRKYSQK